ncbi:MAG: transcriptional regulator [Flavobacteriia bacterium]|nr:MAG: transcriptional regulator [Flavobacteriia bacterium]
MKNPYSVVETILITERSMDLAEAIGITPANLSVLKNGKAKGVRFETLEAICKALDCKPGDIIDYVE